MKPGVSPRIVAEVARIEFNRDCNRQTFKCFRTETLGRLRAVASIIPDDIEVMGWVNEARFVAYDYAPRHNLEW
jgi:hypothetical protein